MIIHLYCDNVLISTFEGNREETGAMLKETAHNLGLAIDDDFELQNRLTVLFNEKGRNDVSYQTGRFRFRLHSPDGIGNAA